MHLKSIENCSLHGVDIDIQYGRLIFFIALALPRISFADVTVDCLEEIDFDGSVASTVASFHDNTIKACLLCEGDIDLVKRLIANTTELLAHTL